QQLGTTWDDYHRAIANDATLLPPGLGYNDSLADVFQLEIDNATAALHTSMSGHVYLRDTAHPLSNVPIELLDPATPQTYSTVTAVADDGTEHSTTTDDAGRYTIDSLPAGIYKVTAQRSDFAPAEIDNITLASGQVLPHINLSLQVGGTISGAVTGPSGAVS